MKHGIYLKPYILVSLLLLLVTAAGCRKAPINGDLDGQWQIISIEENGKDTGYADKQHFYCFYLHVVQLTGNGTVTGNLHYADNQIAMDFPNCDAATLSRLINWGVRHNPEVFDIVKLTGSTLIMQNGDIVVTCRKF